MELTLFELAPGGDAVGRRDDGLVVFVPGGTPGDRVEIDLEAPRKGHARGRLLRVLSPGAERVPLACPLAVPEECGGCPLMAGARPAQLRAKEDWVRRALRPSKLAIPVEILPILAPTSDLGYRLRARLVVRQGRLGFAGARSHRSSAIATCPVLVPELGRVLFGRCAGLAPLLGEGGTVQGLYGQLSGQPAVQLAVQPAPGGRHSAARSAFTELLREGAACGVVWEEGGVRTELGAPAVELGADSEWGPFWGAADGFAQPSAAGHDLLPRLTVAAVAEGDRILELYAGSGNLTRALRRFARRILCVEGDGRAAARSRALFASDPVVRVDSQSALSALTALAAQSPGFDSVVLDPPRTGSRETLPLLAKLGARRIVYVSCDPMTLGRDLGDLARLGYGACRVQPIDLMPHAAHVECVAVLDRV